MPRFLGLGYLRPQKRGVLGKQGDRVRVLGDRRPDSLDPLEGLALVRVDDQLGADGVGRLLHAHLERGHERDLAGDRDLEDPLPPQLAGGVERRPGRPERGQPLEPLQHLLGAGNVGRTPCRPAVPVAAAASQRQGQGQRQGHDAAKRRRPAPIPPLGVHLLTAGGKIPGNPMRFLPPRQPWPPGRGK